MDPKFNRMEDLLRAALNEDELRVLFGRLGLGKDLPGRGVPHPTLCHEAVALLVRKTAIDARFFQELADRAGGRFDEVAALAAAFELPPPTRAASAPPVPPPVPTPTVPTRPARWALLGALPLALGAVGWWITRTEPAPRQPDPPPPPPAPAAPIPITVVTRAPEQPRSQVLVALLAHQARAVVFGDALTADRVGADRTELSAALAQAHSQGVPVLAVSAGPDNLYAERGAPPCLDALLAQDPWAEDPAPPDTFDAIVHGRPSVALALAVLADPSWAPPITADTWADHHAIQVPVRAPPAARPWITRAADALDDAPEPAAGRAVLITDQPARATPPDQGTRPALLAWSLWLAQQEDLR